MILSDETGQFITDARAATLQRLRRALLTPRGTMPGNPTYGSILHRLVGRAGSNQRLGVIAQEVSVVARRILDIQSIRITQPANRTVLVVLNDTLEVEL